MNTAKELLEGTRMDIAIETIRSNCLFRVFIHERVIRAVFRQRNSGSVGQRGADFFRAAGHRIIIIVNGLQAAAHFSNRGIAARASKKWSNGTVVRV